jgi:predicted acylesterase/phospholipase RssA
VSNRSDAGRFPLDLSRAENTMSERLGERADERAAVIAFRAPTELVASIEATAAAEGISRSDVARRAVIRDLQRHAGAAR